MVAMQNPTPISEERVREALAECNGSPTRAAEKLGIHRVTVHKLIKRYGIKVTRTARVA